MCVKVYIWSGYTYDFLKQPIHTIVKHLIAFFSLLLFSCSSPQEHRLGGAMLYTVRAEMADNPYTTLKAVADLGYKYVEVAGYSNGKFYGMSPEDFRAALDKNDLIAVSSHQGINRIEEVDEMITAVKAAGIQYFVIPVPPMGQFFYDNATHKMGMQGDLETLAEQLITIGKKCAEQGVELLYHNHDFEFFADEEGNTIIDYLLQNTPAEYVNFQMDLYWITKAKANPLAYFEKYPGRFKSWHVKDMDQQGRFTPVGEGVIDFESILAHKEKAGMRYYFVEQDRTFDGQKPIEALSISRNNLKRLGFK